MDARGAPAHGGSRGGRYPRMPGADRACSSAAGLHIRTGDVMLRYRFALRPRTGMARPQAAGFPAGAAEDGPRSSAVRRRRLAAATFRPFSGAAGRGDAQGITGGPAPRLGPRFGRWHAQDARPLIARPFVKSRCASGHGGLGGPCRDAREAEAGLLVGGRAGAAPGSGGRGRRATTARPARPFGMRRGALPGGRRPCGAPPGLFGGVGG